MKKQTLILLILLAATHVVSAQDIFQQKLYAPELVLKYREEAGLSNDQVEKIKTLYNSELTVYNNKKWDLDAAMVKLEQMISVPAVDTKATNAQLEKCLTLETDIKKMKLSMLIAIKNLLTPAQQTKLDAHKDEPMPESSITTLLNENQRVVVRVRPGSEASSKKPLYIIVNGDNKKTADSMPADINPESIESIEVLKGESATSIYGKGGENGVIIVKLKKK
ncbi:Spy/CpxP family protein refolding chaperone [Parachryseolinea silvisoli]|jgi:TonB-dependent SusC/RagA subfamily outer membrane receptor|uniref:Spy/CpxP family protein refolding chaperone n=1 Tax=Parachryseolinea silvisoli TaxID=2873601 RepID=UPI002265EAA7|nr:TonB-dependent receptor plug domain-containing protein [Parachryseolinea silvisoli]MCD9015587.1 TonB-dependent receptor plug domain-containing protein [Parachryseolinea silvisoli]